MTGDKPSDIVKRARLAAGFNTTADLAAELTRGNRTLNRESYWAAVESGEKDLTELALKKCLNAIAFAKEDRDRAANSRAAAHRRRQEIFDREAWQTQKAADRYSRQDAAEMYELAQQIAKVAWEAAGETVFVDLAIDSEVFRRPHEIHGNDANFLLNALVIAVKDLSRAIALRQPARDKYPLKVRDNAKGIS